MNTWLAAAGGTSFVGLGWGPFGDGYMLGATAWSTESSGSSATVAVVAAALMAAATWLAVSPPPATPTPRWLRPHALVRRHGRPVRSGRTPSVARVSDLAEVADLLALVLSAGCGIVDALERVGARYPGLLGRQLRTVAAAGRWGLDEEDQWAAMAPQWAPIRGALRIAAESGAAPAAVLAAAAEDLRRGEAHRVEVAASKFGAQAVLPLGLAFLPAFVLTTVVPVVVMLAGDLIGP